MPIEVVVFDIGETIVCEKRAWAQWKTWFNISSAEFYATLGSVIEARKEIRDLFETIRPGIDLQKERAAKEQAGVVWQLCADDLYPDAIPCLESLANAGFRVGIAGNQPASIEPMLEELGLPVAFIASSGRLGLSKPDSRFFDEVVAMSNTSPERIAYVGDRLDNDVLPALQAGMASVFLRRGPWGYIHASWPEASQARVQIDSLDELLGALEEMR